MLPFPMPITSSQSGVPSPSGSSSGFGGWQMSPLTAFLFLLLIVQAGQGA